ARVGSALRVEIPDGRRGLALAALIAKREGADGSAWRSAGFHGHEVAAVSDADALACVVAVEVGSVARPGWDWQLNRPAESSPLIVLCEVERVTIPAPARGEHDGSLERFIASKRGQHEPVDLYRRGRWDNPRMPTIPAARLEPLARPGKLGPGARVRVSEIRPDAQTINDRAGYEGLILARMDSGDYAVQRLEDSAAGPYGSVVRLSRLCLTPVEGEAGQYA
ncbi:MAG TPA: hypothetical protein VFM87_08700, partial [Agrococcus sp.]|nr:hypothetical protein [Agrococcus sp.]